MASLARKRRIGDKEDLGTRENVKRSKMNTVENQPKAKQRIQFDSQSDDDEDDEDDDAYEDQYEYRSDDVHDEDYADSDGDTDEDEGTREKVKRDETDTAENQPKAKQRIQLDSQSDNEVVDDDEDDDEYEDQYENRSDVVADAYYTGNDEDTDDEGTLEKVKRSETDTAENRPKAKQRIRLDSQSDNEVVEDDEDDDEHENEYEYHSDDTDGEDYSGNDEDTDEDEDEGEQPQLLKSLQGKVRDKFYFRGRFNPRRPTAPITPTWNCLDIRKRKEADQIALLLVDAKQEGDNYRWPVREELIPNIPEYSFEDEVAETNAFEEKGMVFAEELTGVPKTEADYSETDSDSEQNEEDEDENESDSDSANEAQHEQSLKQRRMAKRKLKHLRHTNERMANRRLEKVHHFLKSEITAFARRQYREGTKRRVKDLHDFQEQTQSPFYNRAARSSIGSSDAGHEQKDELTAIQEKAAVFASEDALRRILERLPFVIRQGALGKIPKYVSKGTPKPVNFFTDYERRWDTIMTAAKLSGIEDRILKKVGLRMNNLLSLSKQSRYYEVPSGGKFADEVLETEGDK
ncbi:hypothetical protein BGZ65_007489 [Modicella reniformis]|uniref:Uncharacterized protein n=1 Tax=Modicella reniformis TaxID=1440133 RepID=A0A9P6IM97_9FUNG|nr:hypothetical protein BGZ65_007489 [Modicella reniformis]